MNRAYAEMFAHISKYKSDLEDKITRKKKVILPYGLTDMQWYAIVVRISNAFLDENVQPEDYNIKFSGDGCGVYPIANEDFKVFEARLSEIEKERKECWKLLGLYFEDLFIN